MQKFSLTDYDKNKKDIGQIIVFYQYNKFINPNTYLVSTTSFLLNNSSNNFCLLPKFQSSISIG